MSFVRHTVKEMLEENLTYSIKVTGVQAEVHIYYKGDEQENILYACYLAQDNINLVKMKYQQANKFCFTCENGVYNFVVFARKEGSDDIVYKKTECFEIESYQISVIADKDIKNILAKENKYFIYDAMDNADKLCKYVLIDVAYLLQTNNDKEINYINRLIRSAVDLEKTVILLVKCYEGETEINKKTLRFINECGISDVSIIDTHQLLKQVNGDIQYEDFTRFENVLLEELNTIIKREISLLVEDMRVDASITGNILYAKINNENVHDAQYFFYILKDGKIFYKSDVWAFKNELYYELTDSGIYCVQGYIKYKGLSSYAKSHTVEYFCESEKKLFEVFLKDEKYMNYSKKVDFFCVAPPFVDFAIIQSENDVKEINVNEGLKLFKLNSLREGQKRYLLSDAQPLEKDNRKWIASGIVYDSDGQLFGNEILKNNDYEQKKYKGIYTVAIIEEQKIFLSTDYFNFNRLFYYQDEKNIICSNRYHLLLLILKELGIKCELNHNKALMTLSSCRIQFLTQNTLTKMDMNGVYKCPNSFDIVIDCRGLNLVKNEYGETLDKKEYITEEEYREALYKGRDEICDNLQSVLNDKKWDDVIVDITGGMDSRIVYGAAVQSEVNRNKIAVNSYAIAGSNDLEIATEINNIYNFKWDISGIERSTLNIEYSDNMHRSFYMGLYYSHNLISAECKQQKVAKLSGACGEILLRPYIVRKYFGKKLDNIQDDREFLDYILRDYSAELIVDYDAAQNFIDLHKEELQYYGKCSLMEKIDRIYLEHRHAYHFDQGINSRHGTICSMPLQSKELFKLHHNIYDLQKSIKLQLDITNIMNPYLAAIRYDSAKDNDEKELLKDVLFYEKQFHKDLRLKKNDDSPELYNIAKEEKGKRVKVSNKYEKGEDIDFYHKILCDFQYICRHNDAIKNKVGMAVWHYINLHCQDNDRRGLRFLYNKIASLKDQMVIFE